MSALSLRAQPLLRRWVRPFAEGVPLPRLLHPPGATAASGKAQKFAGLVSEELQSHGAVELRPLGAEAAWHSLRALSVGQQAADFQVDWIDGTPSAESEGEQQRRLRILARPGAGWDDVSKDLSEGHFVSNSTNAPGLAKKVEMELRKRKQVTVHTYADAKYAAGTILKALASVPDLAGKDQPLVCTVGAVKGVDEGSVPRVMVHASAPAAWAEVSGDEFIAYPPGANPAEGALKRFRDTVHNRLGHGKVVTMQARGQDAVMHAMEALAEARVRTAEVEVRWVDAFEGSQGAQALQLKAKQGQPWEQFNATDFKKTALLRVGDKTEMKDLAKAIGLEVGRNGAAALHIFSEHRAYVSLAMKAIASAPGSVESGLARISVVPSLGGTKGEKSRRSLRLYMRKV